MAWNLMAWEALMTDAMVTVDLLNSLVEAQFVAEVLEDRGIPHVIRSYRDTAYGALYQSQGAWGVVLAPEEWVDEVRSVILEVRRIPDAPAGDV
jgi:hypothetical protein